MTAVPGQRRAVFLDRDGTVAEEVGYVNHASRIRLLPGSAEAVRRLRDAGFLAVIANERTPFREKIGGQAAAEQIAQWFGDADVTELMDSSVEPR